VFVDVTVSAFWQASAFFLLLLASFSDSFFFFFRSVLAQEKAPQSLQELAAHCIARETITGINAVYSLQEP
jgi:hypothetical protein